MREREREVHRQAVAERLNVAAGGVGRAGQRVATAGEASRVVGMERKTAGRKELVEGEDRNGVEDGAVSQPCFVVGMRSQRGMTSVNNNHRSFPFGGTRGVFPRLCNCAVLSPFLHLPHSSLRLEYLSVHDESVYRRLHDGGDQYAQNSTRSTEGKPKEQQLKS
ncbi:hypothetical protein WN48_07637 [Eufriesea mexicana]|uniref:Uncharacterized protein n=1 Tax=Eufriesea mexicana TaxID=516756 RepID=A0A310SVU6_9HYME|nr:hypothetical protein WN48_07637 [Eufriesea mexicana]